MLIADKAPATARGVYDLPGLQPGNYRFERFDGAETIPVYGVWANVTVYEARNYLIETPAMNGDMRRFDVFRLVDVGDAWRVMNHTFYYTDGRGNT